MRSRGSKLIILGQVFAGLTSLVALTVCANYVGAKVFGFCSVLILVLNIAITLMDFGACSWASREYAAHRMSVGTFKNVMWSKTKLNMCIAILAPLFFLDNMNEFKFAVILLVYPVLWNRSNYLQQYLLARNQVRESVSLVLLDRTCWLLIIPLSFHNVDESLAFATPIIVGLILQSLFFKKLLTQNEVNEGEIVYYNQKALFGVSKHFGTISTSGVISNFDGVLVASLSSISESSSFLLAQRFRNPMTIVFTSIAMRVRPIAASKDVQSIKSTLKEDSKLMAVSIFSTLGIAVFLLEFSEYFLGPEFKGSGPVIFFGVVASIPMGALLLSSSILSAMGAEKFVAKTNSSYSLIILLGVSIGTFVDGSFGAVLSALLIISIHAMIFTLRLRSALEFLK